jgi:AcrR family transcriptional regulator
MSVTYANETEPKGAGVMAAVERLKGDSPDASLTGRDRQREETRRRLRECALTVFRRDGVAAARIDDIVKSARVSRGTFYFHFPTKEDVIVECLGEAEGRIAAAIERLPKSTPLRRMLEATCIAIADEWEDEPELFPDVGGVAVRRASAAFRTGEPDAVSRALTEAFRSAVKKKELTPVMPPEILADFFLINVFAATLAWCAHRKGPLKPILVSVIDIFLGGARAPRR